MQTYSISPLDAPPATQVSVPGSKSHTNRALLIAALAKGTTTLTNALFSDDSQYFAEALVTLGFKVDLAPDKKTITIAGLGGEIPVQQANIFIGNAGTAARFLTAMLTLGRGEFKIDGVERMRQRPIGDLVVALNNLGSEIAGVPSVAGDQRAICPPVTVTADGLSGGATIIRGDISSQFLSGLLMVAPYAQSEVKITVDGPLHSKPYIDLTLGVTADFGVEIQREGYDQFIADPAALHYPRNLSHRKRCFGCLLLFRRPSNLRRLDRSCQLVAYGPSR